jgi:FlaG/FlaF family flagellin (archaellin)
MKAVSPFIATVLLIAFTIGVAGIIGSFIYNTMSTQTGEVGKSSDKQAKCGSSVLQIDEVKTDSDLNPVNVTFTYINGDQNLYNFTVSIIDSESGLYSTSTLSPDYTSSSPLLPGRQTFWSITTSGLSGSLSSVRIQGYCQQTYIISAACESGRECMKS